MEEQLNRILVSPLFWLLSIGFGLIALQISYTYYKFDRKRSRKYDQLYKILDRHESTKVSSMEALNEEIEQVDYQLGEIDTEMRNINEKIYYDNLIDSQAVNEATARREELKKIQTDLFFKKETLQQRQKYTETLERSKRRRSIEFLRNEIQNLLSSD
jgi:hypothetical protein